MRSVQGKMLLGDDNGISRTSRGRISIKDHKNFETYLERYRGLLLYLKEMDESAYGKTCGVRGNRDVVDSCSQPSLC